MQAASPEPFVSQFVVKPYRALLRSHDLEEFLDLARSLLDPRQVQTPHPQLYQWLITSLDQSLIVSGSYGDRQTRKLAIIWLMHLTAYVTGSAELQAEAIRQLAQLRDLAGDWTYEYLNRVIRLYGANTQDRCLSSTAAMPKHLQATLLEQHRRLLHFTTSSGPQTSHFSQAVEFTDSAAVFSVLALEIEKAGPAAGKQIAQLDNLENRDLDAGLPLYSSIYNCLPRIEYLLASSQFDAALEECDANLSLLIGGGLRGSFSELQLRLKRVKTLHQLLAHSRSQRQSTLHDLAAEIDIAVDSARQNGNPAIENELVTLKYSLDLLND